MPPGIPRIAVQPTASAAAALARNGPMPLFSASEAGHHPHKRIFGVRFALLHC